MKIKYSVLDNDKFAKLTKRAVDLLLYLVKNQDDAGVVYGVHYSDVVKDTGMVKQSFYNALKELTEYNFIDYRQDKVNNCYKVVVLNNSFANKAEDYKEGYINLQRAIFHKKSFRELKAHEQYLVLIMLKSTHAKRGSFQIKPETFYNKYTKLFGVSRRVVRSYLHSIKKFFSIGLKNGLYYITYKTNEFKDKLNHPQRFYEDMAQIKKFVHKYKIRSTNENEVEQMADMIQQYRNKAKNKAEDLLKLIESAIWYTTKDILQKHRNLPFKYINQLLSEHFKDDKQIPCPYSTYPDGTWNESHFC